MDGFVKYISASSFSVTGGYLGSWDFIKQYRHSLERFTNLGICIDRALNQQFYIEKQKHLRGRPPKGDIVVFSVNPN